eukprot:9930376-Heterocapsa_arctica.AAC.1
MHNLWRVRGRQQRSEMRPCIQTDMVRQCSTVALSSPSRLTRIAPWDVICRADQMPDAAFSFER